MQNNKVNKLRYTNYSRCACLLVTLLMLLLLFALAGCGVGGRKRTPTEKLPKGVLEYSIPPYNDEFKFASLFLYEAIRQRKVADLYNQMVLRYDMKKGDSKELEKLLKNTTRAYRRAARAAYIAYDVGLGLKQIEALPNYSPYKKLKRQKTAFVVPEKLLDPLFSVACAGSPYIERFEIDYMTGAVKNYYNNGTSTISQGSIQVYPEKGKRIVEDKQRYKEYENEKTKETKLVKLASTAVNKDIMKVRKQAEATARNDLKQLEQEAFKRVQARDLQDKARNEYQGSWAAPKESSDLIVKHGAKQIVELYDAFPAGDNLRGLAKALHIKGKTDYETYQKAYDVYKRSREITGFAGTKSSKQELKEAENAYRNGYVTAAAGKAAEAGLAIATFKATGGLLGATDAGAKISDAVAWGYQAVNVVKTGDEDENLKKIQNTTGLATSITGLASVIKSAPDWGKGLANAYDKYKDSPSVLDGFVDGTKELVKNLGVNSDTYDKVAGGALIMSVDTDGMTMNSDPKAMAERMKDKYGINIDLNDDGTINVQTVVTNDKDPQKMEKLKAVTGLSESEIKEEEKELNKLPKDVPVREIKKKIKEYEDNNESWLDLPASKEEVPVRKEDKGVSGEVSGEESGDKSGQTSGTKDEKKNTDEVSGIEDKHSDSGQESGEVSGETDGDAPYAVYKVIGASYDYSYSAEGKTYHAHFKVIRAGNGIAILIDDGLGGEKETAKVTSYDPQTGKGVAVNHGDTGAFQIVGTEGKMKLILK